ncbi:membrane dipeptidase [Altererythrobacter sp. BO-6]|uniref:dipeptidase n=1 Tax=Altererythrobacter sp. BO-6 TaxID=2604537 RepID=UPI0013E10174|nr:dipeptidase [Altererythrobacter sp. BO-6]QIG53693.1 membrane dipeptidase [Altererythrobacter sp. BO-6]
MKSVSMIAATLLLAAPVMLAAQTPEEVAAAALRAAPVMDGHNDVPIQLRGRFGNVIADFDFHDTTDTASTEPRRAAMHTDIARLREGKVGAQYWSVYVPASLEEPEAVQMTIEQIDVTKRLIERYPDDLQLALTADDVESALAAGKIASLMGMEGGHSIGSSLGVLRQMYDLGARYMTLTHSKNTPWADSATDAPAHNGLTDFGRDVIREMNRLGMQVDLSHVSEKTMHDVLDVAKAPVIFSHSSARALNGHARNVPDSVLQRLPANGGIVMVTFVPGFLSEPARQWNANRDAEKARLEALWQGQPEQVEQGLKLWDDRNPLPQASVRDVADHIDHVRAVAGIDHIGIGGDYDGIPFAPPGLEDVSGYPALFVELARRGYSQADLEKISLRNALRALRGAEAYAASQRGAPAIETVVTGG